MFNQSMQNNHNTYSISVLWPRLLYHSRQQKGDHSRDSHWMSRAESKKKDKWLWQNATKNGNGVYYENKIWWHLYLSNAPGSSVRVAQSGAKWDLCIRRTHIWEFNYADNPECHSRPLSVSDEKASNNDNQALLTAICMGISTRSNQFTTLLLMFTIVDLARC